MSLRRFLLSVSCLFAFTATFVRCQREYSYEAKPAQPSSKDTAQVRPFVPACRYCNATAPLPDSSWQFTVQGAVLCGRAEKALMTFERKSFTFFGPSACSPDSGFVATVYLNEPLDATKTNIAAGYVAVYYYDRVKPSYVLISRQGSGFSLSITRYDHQTREAEGWFTGVCYTEGGEAKTIEGGRFRIRFS